MKSTKNAKLGTFLDVSSFETPFSYCGRMSETNVRMMFGFTRLCLILELSHISKNVENTQKV